jgi:hypothetical protein
VRGSASAVTIFSDDFNRAISDTVGNSWTETEGASSSVSIVHVTGATGDNQLKLQGSLGNNTDLDAAVAQLAGLSTASLQNITLSFDFLGLNTGSSNTPQPKGNYTAAPHGQQLGSLR